MKKCYICQRQKEKTDFYKNKSKPKGISDECKECKKRYINSWRNKNLEKVKKYKEKTYLNNQNYYKFKSILWAKNNPGKATARTRKYQLNKENAIPKWLSDKEMKEIEQLYILAQDKTLKTGIKYEVDHIIPINGKIICGLHVLKNLQIITKKENLKKLNSYVESKLSK